MGPFNLSSKLEFLTLKWSIMEHFKEYLTYLPFVVQTDNNPLTYVLTTPDLDATRHLWVSTLASFQFKLEYQKGDYNGTTDALSWVPISHSWETIQSLLEGVVVGAANWGEVRVSKEILEEHECLSEGTSGEACTHAHCRLGRSPGARCHLSHMLQVTPSLEGHATPKAGCPSQEVSGNGG